MNKQIIMPGLLLIFVMSANNAAAANAEFAGEVASHAAANKDAAEEAAFRRAVARVTPSLVRLETIGGPQPTADIIVDRGPTSGLIVDADGYIVSSEFRFLGRPDSILVRFADGRRRAARLVASDHNLKLVLLKVDLDEEEKGKLPLPEFIDRDEIRVGQWAIAVGRVLDAERPNICVGIVSATNRIWGKAIGTDADASPNNYGGPLLDIRGRVMGVLAPLDPGGSATDGLRWYDSGIGFAIAADDVRRSVERLKLGRDLHGGFLGLSFAGTNPSISPAVVAACLPGSPAQKAGLQTGDRIVSIAGQPIRRAADVLEALGRRYAGENISMAIKRDGRELQVDVRLAAAPKSACKDINSRALLHNIQ